MGVTENQSNGEANGEALELEDIDITDGTPAGICHISISLRLLL